MPETLKTIGDHIRRRRLALGLIQKQVAKIIDVCTPSIVNWETGRSEPHLKYMPAIIKFVGYDPVPPPDTLASRLVCGRKAAGLSQKEAARRVGVDQGTLARWERGERQPTGAFLARVMHFLCETEEAASRTNARRTA